MRHEYATLRLSDVDRHGAHPSAASRSHSAASHLPAAVSVERGGVIGLGQRPSRSSTQIGRNGRTSASGPSGPLRRRGACWMVAL